MRWALVFSALFGLCAVGLWVNQKHAVFIATDTGEVAAAKEMAWATVEVVDLGQVAEFTGLVSWGSSVSIATDATGVITASVSAGATVRAGDVVVAVNARPLFVGDGPVPMYRELALTSPPMSGPDVEQLQEFLTDQGFGNAAGFKVDAKFGALTRTALKDWQRDVGLEATGRIDSSQLVFFDGPVRVVSELVVGARFETLEVVGSTATLVVTDSATKLNALTPGATVQVNYRDNYIVDAVVAEVQQSVTETGAVQGHATIALPTNPPGHLVALNMSVDTVTQNQVLAVPAAAIFALADGRFAVEILNANNETQAVEVRLGIQVDDQVVIEAGLTAGDRVVIAS